MCQWIPNPEHTTYLWTIWANSLWVQTRLSLLKGGIRYRGILSAPKVKIFSKDFAQVPTFGGGSLV